MNKRFCKLGRIGANALLLIAIGGSLYSCKDDYTLDNSNPSWLGSSIYEYLETEGNYKNFVKLIDDLDYKEVLARTGSKTVFVADDDAFKNFYADNPWGVKSYQDLNMSQKKLLLNSAMINNAYLLEMMSSTPATGEGDNAEPEKGQCLRRETAADVMDSIPHLFKEDLPVTFNPTDKDYWARFRENPKGIYMALDATTPMMTHFLAGQMSNLSITDEDFEKITGKKREKNDAYIFDSKVIKQDITCQNGYINLLDKVLVNPQNMAEMIRTNHDTKIFSHLLDRFSAPFYSSTLTERYRLLHGNDVDSVWEKRYFSARSQQNLELQSDANTDPIGNPSGNEVSYYLQFDPGWNSYMADEKTAKERDMAVIFCPTDNRLKEYFFSEEGGGRFLIKAYAPETLGKVTPETSDLNEIYKAIDQIPLEVIQALLNNLMKSSFNSTVPSKFMSVKNSAQDAMFDAEDNYHADRIERTLIANNGVVYIMDEVTTPADYASVSAPAYVETDKRIFNWAIQRGRKNQSEFLGNVPVNYYAYLLAMSTRFSFFVPQDANFWYIDPASFYNPTVTPSTEGATLTGRAYHYTWDEAKAQPKVESYEYILDRATGKGTIGQAMARETVSQTCYGNRLKDMLETHTIIHEDNTEITGIDETETGVECNQHYFYTKNNAIVRVDNATARKEGMTLSTGGVKADNTGEWNVIGFDDKSSQKNGYGNGFAYMIDQPMIPTIESVYSGMYNIDNFKKFFSLCQTDGEVLEALGLKTNAERNKFLIFVDQKGLPCFDKNTGERISKETNVRFFNNYRYTVYVPTNAAMTAAENLGLPTWQDLRDLFELDKDASERTDLTSKQEQERIDKGLAMATQIVNFVKYHFQDNAVFVDQSGIKPYDFETATLNNATGTYFKLNVQSAGGSDLKLTDLTGKTASLSSDPAEHNIIVRDYITSGGNSAISNNIISSSSAVLHGINNVLNYKTYDNGRYDSDWSTPAKARAYVKKYELKD